MRIRREIDVEKLTRLGVEALGQWSGSTPAPIIQTVDTVFERVDLYCNGPKLGKINLDPRLCAVAPSVILSSCKKEKLTSNCQDVVVQGVQKYCNDNTKSVACIWLDEFTTTMKPTEEPAGKTTSGGLSNNLPLIIGGVIGVIVLLAIGIGLFIYCRKKKKTSAPGKSMTGTTGGGSTTGSFSGTGTENRSGTGNRSGFGTTGTNTASKY